LGGSIPADLAAAATTITVPHRASLFLVGTGAEAIAASFIVQGSLSLMMLSVTGSLSVGSGGDVHIASCGGTLSSVSVIGGSLTIDAMSPIAMSGTVSLSTSAHLSLRGRQQFSNALLTVNSGCVMDITGCSGTLSSTTVGGSLTVTQTIFSGTSSTTAISVAAGGSLTVTQTTFTGTGSSTAILVAAGGNLTVSASQLVDSTGHHTQPFPCDGTLAHGCAGAHVGAVMVRGAMVITTAAPLVCEAASGRCVADQCVADAGWCGASVNTCVSPGTCRCAAGWQGARCGTCAPGHSGPTCQLGGCPPGATASGTYCSDLAGYCQGPGGSSDYVNGKGKPYVASRPACRAFCDAAPACVGYSYRASDGDCNVYGPGLDTDLARGWYALTHPATTIGGASGNSVWVCAAVAGRN
jgi:hypothetical protein